MKNIIDASSAERILIPKGDDSLPCIRAFEEETGIEVPDFSTLDRRLSVFSNGRTFYQVKGKDVPSLIDLGVADVGLTGSDSYQEFGDDSLRYQQIGERMCRFVLLAPATKLESMKWLTSGRRVQAALPVVTSFPRLLYKCAAVRDLPIVPFRPTLNGSIEIMPTLLGCDLAADIVNEGKTIARNGLVEIDNLFDVYPVLIAGRQA